jgi:hypothetical protein
MSSLKEEANLIAFQHFLEKLSSSSNTLKDKVNNNIAVQEVALEGLQLDPNRTIEVQDISIEGLQSVLVRTTKMQESNIEGFII